MIETPSREAVRRRIELCVERREPFHASALGRGERGAIELPPAILELWPDDLIVRVGAGIQLAELERRLAVHGLALGIDAPTPERSTLGGILARAECGRGGAPNDSLRSRLLGLCAIDGRARLLKAGARVVKNVAGYDLARLHHGMQGSLGVVLDLTLRLSARPAASALRAFECECDELPQRLAALRRPNLPLDPDCASWLNAAAATRLGLSNRALLVLELRGSAELVRAWSAQVGGEHFVSMQAVRDFAADAAHFDWSCPLRRLDFAQRELGEAFALRADPIGGRHKLLCDSAEPEFSRRLTELGRKTQEWGGALFAAEPWRTPRLSTRKHPVAERLKSAFDPHGLLPALPEAIG